MRLSRFRQKRSRYLQAHRARAQDGRAKVREAAAFACRRGVHVACALRAPVCLRRVAPGRETARTCTLLRGGWPAEGLFRVGNLGLSGEVRTSERGWTRRYTGFDGSSALAGGGGATRVPLSRGSRVPYLAGRRRPLAISAQGAVSIPARGGAPPGGEGTCHPGGRDGPWQDGSGHRGRAAATRNGRHPPHAGRRPGFTQGGMGGADRLLLRRFVRIALRHAADSSCTLRADGILLRDRQLRTGDPRLEGDQRDPQTGPNHPGRGPAYQELEDEDGAEPEGTRLALCVCPDRHAD